MQHWKRHLVAHFSSLPQPHNCIFVETVASVPSTRHTVIHCFPLPLQQFLQSPLLFRKALEEDVDSEWAQHRRIIPVRAYGTAPEHLHTTCLRGVVQIDGAYRGGGGLHTAISKQAPYFSVEFGVDGGFAHVIEERENFPLELGHQLVCSITEQQPDLVLRDRTTLEQPHLHRDNFRNAFAKHNWSMKLKVNQICTTPSEAVIEQSKASHGESQEAALTADATGRVAHAAALAHSALHNQFSSGQVVK